MKRKILSHRKAYTMIAESASMKKILKDIEQIAQSQASVFISGESGTGKEIVSQTLHYQSSRSDAPFIKVNCAAIPETLIESEFFGHEKGAFTDAVQRRLGRFELADKGTLLLDEVSELPLALQSKLLRVVQEQEFERIGGSLPIQVNVRIISTSNRNMKESVEKKLFREDLYYRLNVIPIHIPALRERKEDILPLAESFLQGLCAENRKPLKRLSAAAENKLIDYAWPGNIRELANLIERTVVMHCGDIIEAEHLMLDSGHSFPSLPMGYSLEQLEKKMILETLASHQHNRTKTAEVLGISLRTLRNKLNLYKSANELRLPF